MRRLDPVAGYALVCVLVVALVVASVTGAGLVGVTAGQDDSDRPGAGVAEVLNAQGEAVDAPVESADATFDGEFYAQVSSIVGSYNDTQPDLGLGSGLVTGNIVNFHVTGADGEETVVSFRITGDNRITDVRAGARDGARIRMTTDRATVDRIAGADDPGTAFRDAVEAGDVRISGRGLWSSAVWFVVNNLRGFAGGR